MKAKMIALAAALCLAAICMPQIAFAEAKAADYTSNLINHDMLWLEMLQTLMAQRPLTQPNRCYLPNQAQDHTTSARSML